jgi:serine protease Do
MKNFLISLIVVLLSILQVPAQDLSILFEKLKPAVVVILTEEEETVSVGGLSQRVTSSGLGSGVMISEREIVTAAHVVQVAENIKVQFSDGEIIPAKVKSALKFSDVALIELIYPKKNAVIAKFGNSDELKTGERIFIIGAPYGLSYSLSSGYVSGRLSEGNPNNPFIFHEMIQTDAAINHGNSGGPMFNLDGEVVGIVSYILSESGGFEGIGFAASANMTKRLLFDRHTFWTGVDAILLKDEMAKVFNLPQPYGLMVQRVVFLSPFGIAGVQGGRYDITYEDRTIKVGGDIILAFNGIPISMDKLSLLAIAGEMEKIGPEDPFELTVLRGGKVITLRKE